MPALPHLCCSIRFSSPTLVHVGVRYCKEDDGQDRDILNRTMSISGLLQLSSSFCAFLPNSSPKAQFGSYSFFQIFYDNDDDDFDNNDGFDDSGGSGCIY